MRPVFKEGLHYATCLQGGTSSRDLSSRRDFIMRSPVSKERLHHAITCLQGRTSSCDLSSRKDFIMRPVFKEGLHHATCLQGETSSCDHLSPRSDFIMRPPVFKKRHHHATCLQGETPIIATCLQRQSLSQPVKISLHPRAGRFVCFIWLLSLFVHVAKRCLFILYFYARFILLYFDCEVMYLTMA